MKFYQVQNGNLKVNLAQIIFEKLSIKNVKDKIKAFYFYKSEIQNKQMPRTSDGIRTLAKLRGKIISSDYAESFKIVRT